MGKTSPKKHLARHGGYLISLSLFFVAIVILHHELRHYHVWDMVAGLKRAKPTILGLAVLLTVLDYLVLTLYDVLALRYVRHRLEYTRIAVASFIGHVFSHNMTIIGGSTARYRIYSAMGVSASEVARLVIFCGLTFWLGFFTVCGCVLLVAPREALSNLHVPFTLAWLAGVIFLSLVLMYLVFVAFRRQPLSIRGWELTIPSVPVSAGQIAIASLDWLLACAVLYAILPTATELTYFKFLGIFMLAQAAGLLSYIPGGLGVFDTVVLLLLSDRLEKSQIVSSLVLYRLVYYLLPLATGTCLLAVHELAVKKHILRRFRIAFEKWSSAVTPNFLAVTSFIAGSILLFSGSLPAAKGRLDWLEELLPFPAIEISHFMGSLAGAGLLILARGIQRRVDAAYHLTLVLFGLGIVFSILKGLDYEEAIVLAVMLLLFLPCRREFYRKMSLVRQPFTPAWIILIVATVISSIWLGIFSYKHVEYSSQLWWRFAANAEAPRSLRAAMGLQLWSCYTALQD